MPPALLALAGPAMSLIGGAVGNAAAQGDRDKAAQQRAQALQQFLNVNVPNPADQQIYLDQLRSQGELTPEMEEVFNLGKSQMEQVSTDPRLKEAQMSALQKLQQMGDEGLGAQDRLVLSQVKQQADRDNRGRQEAVLQNMAQRGALGSGAELAARLQASQQSAEEQANQGLNMAAQAQQRALQAIAQSGQLGGQIRGQDFSEAGAKAQAADEIAKFNAMNSQNVNSRNVSSRNQAQAANLANAQRIADTNVGLANQQQMYNKNLIQQNFENNMSKARGAAGQYDSSAKSFDNSADRTANMWSTIGQGVGSGFNAYNQYQANQKK